MTTTHVFIVDTNTFKYHLEYLFAGTGAKDNFVEVNDDCIAALRYGTEELWHGEVYSGFISNYSLSDLGL